MCTLSKLRYPAVGELLRLLIAAYKDIFRSNLTDAVLLQNFGQTALVVDELCKEVSIHGHLAASLLLCVAQAGLCTMLHYIP